jgi:UDP-N-acetylmuramoylalanine--D-glutamate ligase
LRAPACGNIGIPITDILNVSPPGQPYDCDVLVAELSSFQITFSPTLKTKVGIFTNFKADHLDWHGSLEGYRDAKLSLFTGDRAPDWSILPAEDPIGIVAAERTPYEVLWFSRNETTVAKYAHKIYLDSSGDFILEAKGEGKIRLFNKQDLFIIGAHNEENVLAAAAAAWLMGVKPEQIAASCKSFKGLEHRLEQLAPIGPYSVLFFNDSKATNTDAAISALKAFEGRPLILIAGGYDKMTPLEEFAEEVKKAAKHVILIGTAKERFAEALRVAGVANIHFAPTLEAAASLGLTLSLGEPVLFSPACSSFDMFKNFEERGLVFKRAVTTLGQADLSFAKAGDA